MTHFDGRGDISVYLALLEKQISRMNIVNENWVMHLLSWLLLGIVNIAAREQDPGQTIMILRKKIAPETF